MRANNEDWRRVDDIIAAFLALGKHQLTLAELYEYIGNRPHPDTRLNGDWKATVRRELQAYCHEASGWRYKDNRDKDLFRQVSPGVWKLYKEQPSEQGDAASAITLTK